MALITQAELAAFRRDAESLMVDTCTIRHPSTRGALNQSTGAHTSTLGAVIYTGKCKRQVGPSQAVVESGDREVTVARSELHIPANAKTPAGTPARPPVGAIATMDACPNDPAAVGSKLRITGPSSKTWASAQRLNVTEVQG